MFKKMATSCKVLNDVLRDPKKYEELEENDKMNKMNHLDKLCEEFVKKVNI